MDLREIEWESVVWVLPALDRDQRRALVNMVKKIGYHKRREFLEQLSTICFSRRTLLHEVCVLLSQLFNVTVCIPLYKRHLYKSAGAWGPLVIHTALRKPFTLNMVCMSLSSQFGPLLFYLVFACV
jgi:hypothetical protein